MPWILSSFLIGGCSPLLCSLNPLQSSRCGHGLPFLQSLFFGSNWPDSWLAPCQKSLKNIHQKRSIANKCFFLLRKIVFYDEHFTCGVNTGQMVMGRDKKKPHGNKTLLDVVPQTIIMCYPSPSSHQSNTRHPTKREEEGQVWGNVWVKRVAAGDVNPAPSGGGERHVNCFFPRHNF